MSLWVFQAILQLWVKKHGLVTKLKTLACLMQTEGAAALQLELVMISVFDTMHGVYES